MEAHAPDDPDRAGRTTGRQSARRRVVVLALLFVTLFVVLLAVTFPDGRATRFQGVPATATLDEAASQMAGSDAHSYLQVGRDLGVDGEVPVARRYVLNFWPPGMPAFFAALFAIFGADMPIGIVVGVTLAALLAGVLTLWAELLLRYLPVWAVALVLGAVVFCYVTRDWILGFGLFWSEGLYTITMLVALYGAARLAIASSSRARLWWAGASGVALGASAYVRTTSEILGRALTAVVIVWALAALVHRGLRRRRARRGKDVGPLRSWNQQLLALALCMAMFHAVTVPWRVFAARELRPDNYTWSVVTNLYWHQQWMPDRIIRQRSREFLVAGGANTACKVDPEKCRRIADVELGYFNSYSPASLGYSELEFRRFTLDTLKEHPFEWARRRIAILPDSWFESAATGSTAHAAEPLQSAILLALLGAVLVLSIVRIRRWGPDLLALLVPTLVVTVIVPSVFLQWEGRYFYPLKIMVILAFAVLLGLELTHPHPADGPSPSPRSETDVDPAPM